MFGHSHRHGQRSSFDQVIEQNVFGKDKSECFPPMKQRRFFLTCLNDIIHKTWCRTCDRCCDAMVRFTPRCAADPAAISMDGVLTLSAKARRPFRAINKAGDSKLNTSSSGHKQLQTRLFFHNDASIFEESLPHGWPDVADYWRIAGQGPKCNLHVICQKGERSGGKRQGPPALGCWRHLREAFFFDLPSALLQDTDRLCTCRLLRTAQASGSGGWRELMETYVVILHHGIFTLYVVQLT
jgi:hypothetical protein